MESTAGIIINQLLILQVTEIKGKSILITGCSSGIGRIVARGLRARGHLVFTSARDAEDVRELIAEGFHAFRLDLECPQSICNTVKAVLEQTDGRLYALFNNGAYGQPGAVEDITREVLRSQFETNLFGWHDLTRQVIPVMRRQGEGRIIQNSSVLGFAAMKYRGAYNASKFAVEGLTDTLRLELHGTGIKVSLIEPGPIASKFRINAYKKWKENIDCTNSYHLEAYQAMVQRLMSEKPTRFTLPPESVLKRVVHALESANPQARYYVTFPTYLFGALKRVLPIKTLDWLLRKI